MFVRKALSTRPSHLVCWYLTGLFTGWSRHSRYLQRIPNYLTRDSPLRPSTGLECRSTCLPITIFTRKKFKSTVLSPGNEQTRALIGVKRLVGCTLQKKQYEMLCKQNRKCMVFEKF